MNLDLNGKRAIVCGSTRGIGKAIALELAMLGAHVTLFARDESRLRATLAEMRSGPQQRHDYLVADFNFTEKVRSVIGQYAKKTQCIFWLTTLGDRRGDWQ